MLIFLLIAVFAIVGLCPDTALGRVLRRVLVEWPAGRLARMTRRKLVVRVAMLALVLGAITAAKLLEDGIMFLQFVPEGLAWIAAVDVTGFLELMAAIWLVAATVRLRTVHHTAKAAAARARQWSLRRLRPPLAAFARFGMSAARQIRARLSSARRGDDEDRPAPDLIFA